ncbi:hypothetical protein E2562_000324 [Oryza meyeriana var. granulata]|uniref:VWA-Hint protein Vwaint domain-containing protein n=1 Tax=Oryza meyeriana var. granulata TaxID=110450 RepID=A0A6G1CP71_9ORYZ|nr:hypothetical protein E2562_000324 [Oryza meyeriana var. granulata]
MSGDAMCAALVAELRELSECASDERDYVQTGRACMLAGMSSHAQQRALSVRLSGIQFQVHVILTHVYTILICD